MNCNVLCRVHNLITAAGVVLATGPAFGATVFINELHYDNVSGDIGEAVEIAGPAGTDLNHWQVVFYNGGNGSPYATLNLSGVLPDEQAGVGAVSFEQSGIQNGGPDGLALVDPLGVVREFLSYEGSFTAVGGPADGLASMDMGVAETTSTPEGESLQRFGTGRTSPDFTWTGPATASFGSLNGGQTITPVPLPAAATLLLPSLAVAGLLARRRSPGGA